MSVLRVLEGRYAVCRLAPDDPVPEFASGGTFYSITRTASELSMVCAEDRVPAGVQFEGGWRIFQVEGPLDFALTGILASIAMPLAQAGIAIFAISTFDTDFVLVKEEKLTRAIEALTGAGHTAF